MDTSKFTPLNGTEHNQLSYRQLNQYEFAAGEHAVPLLFNELPKAAKCFPILFALEGLPVPFALLSLEKGRNSFVQADGTWKGNYIPLHFRRYPFLLGSGDRSKMAVMVDPDAPQLQSADGKALYVQDNGTFKPSEALEEIKAGLVTFQETFEATKQLGMMLRAAEVLVPARLTLQPTADTEQQTLAGFAVVDPQKVNQLDEQVRKSWKKLGLTAVIEMHLNSIAPWLPAPGQ